MQAWVSRINAAVTPDSGGSTPGARAQTLPASSGGAASAEKGDRKSRFGSLGKKK